MIEKLICILAGGRASALPACFEAAGNNRFWGPNNHATYLAG
jgi:hypothetical protein